MRKKLIIIILILIGCRGFNLMAADGSCAASPLASCQQIDDSLTETQPNSLQWNEMGWGHVLPSGYKNTTSSNYVGRSQSYCNPARASHQPIPIPSRHCVKAATLPICTADFYVFQLLRLRL